MAIASDLKLFTEMLDHLNRASKCLKLVQSRKNCSRSPVEAEKKAAQKVAMKALEVAAGALQLYRRVDEPGGGRNLLN